MTNKKLVAIFKKVIAAPVTEATEDTAAHPII